MKRAVRTVRVVGLALLLAMAIPGVAMAHALLLSSAPSQGQVLGTAPGIVTLRFSESLEPQTSSATVTDPTGSSFNGGVNGQTIVVPLATNAPGTYKVTWRSVSAEDGHTLQGSFEFSVQSRGAATSSTSSSSGGAGTALLRWVEYLALLLAIGTVFIRSRARREPPVDWVRSGGSLAIGVLLIAAASVALADAVISSASPSLHGAVTYLTSGRPGVARVLVVMGALAALIASMARWWVWPWLLGTLIALAASGHAAAVDPAWWGITVDSVHLLAASGWAGGILALALLRPPGGWGGDEAHRLLDRFSPFAIAAFLVTVGFGFIQSVQDVGSVRALATSGYGRTLVVKIIAVGAMVPLSVLAWRRRIAPRGEALIAVLVVGASALLSSFALPAAQAQPPQIPNTVASALPRPGDLTLGSHAGQVLVGLTLRPGAPGIDEALVYLQPIEGDPAKLETSLEVNGRDTTLGVCGPNCRRATVGVSGGEKVSVVVAGPTGGTARFTIPPLPAASGLDLLDLAQQRMHALRTYRLHEVLSSGLASLTSRYRFQAPDRMAIRSRGTSTVLIGGTRYLQEAPAGHWKIQQGGFPVPVPSFIWDFFKPLIDVRVLAHQRIGGIMTNEIAFYGNSGDTPVWFRLWVDDRGLVHQAHMRAVGHFMDHRYFAFNAPLQIRPPASARTGGP